MKKKLMNAFLSDPSLPGLVGKLKDGETPCIFFSTPLADVPLPAVSFFIKETKDLIFADDVCIQKSVGVQVDVWAEKGVDAVAGRAETALRALGLRLRSSGDVPEPNRQHAVLLFEGVLEEE